MQYEIAGVAGLLDLPTFTRLITDADPAAVVDVAPASRTLRMSTSLDRDALLQVLGRSGGDTANAVVEALPSQCCGGCGG